MAEQEVAKHTKNLLGAAAGKHGIAHKLREIALEMVIIVFAVSISIWFHSMGEHRHEQAQVRTFLLGLKSDIQSDMAQLSDVIAFHREADQRYAWLAELGPSVAPDPARFDGSYKLISSNNFLVARQGRYEGFKSAGKLTNIEDDKLLDRIIELYEYDIPKLKLSSGGWISNHNRLLDYLQEATSEDDSLQTRYRSLAARKGKLLLQHMSTFPQLYTRAQKVLDEKKGHRRRHRCGVSGPSRAAALIEERDSVLDRARCLAVHSFHVPDSASVHFPIARRRAMPGDATSCPRVIHV